MSNRLIPGTSAMLRIWYLAVKLAIRDLTQCHHGLGQLGENRSGSEQELYSYVPVRFSRFTCHFFANTQRIFGFFMPLVSEDL
jgi:hypothetical protein